MGAVNIIPTLIALRKKSFWNFVKVLQLDAMQARKRCALHNVVYGWIHSVAVDESADEDILHEGRSDELDGICAEELNLNRTNYMA